MQTSRQSLFTTIRTEGALLPADLLARIAEGDRSLPGLTPEAYHLPVGEKMNEATNRAWNHALGAWTTFKAATKRLAEGNPATTETRERWLLPLLQELGYGRLPAARAVEMDSKSYPISHLWGHVPIHLVGAGIDLDRRTAGVAGAARTSPHSLVQELLNSSSDSLWAFVSNGLRLRILRNNAKLTRQAYVEFDLEAMMEGEVYADFVLLWLLCHESRVGGEKPEECWLEQWSRLAEAQGTRALDQLRSGVEQAIVALGRGFLTHPANSALREQLRTGTLDAQEYYRQLLRLVYRLIFLFVAEDRDLLLDPSATPEARARYRQYYSMARLRRMAGRLRGTRHSDLFYGLRLVMEKLGDDLGCSELGLPALGSFLFSAGEQGAIPALEGCELANRDLLHAVRELMLTMDDNVRRTVDYKNLGSEELGSVYEALLELHPVLNISAGAFALETAGGNERKTTGSYYTPTSLINALLDSALEPVLEKAARQADPETAILNLKICDPACGSGHFLIAAAHRIAKRLASTRTGDAEPAPEAMRRAVRDAVGRCIYGVDINPMAVELCKVSLWMEAVEPGKPLSFLEHHIQCGNALLGAIPALLRGGIPDDAFDAIEGDERDVCSEFKKRNKEERKGRMQLFGYDLQPWEHLDDLASSVQRLADISDDTIGGIHQKQQQWEGMVRSEEYLFNRLLADAWCAAFVWKKTRQFAYPITDQVFRRIEENPIAIAPWMLDEIKRLANQYQFFHWHLAFPEVLYLPGQDEHSENELAGWCGGFDVVLGNPPWERIKIQEKEWFAARRPDIANAPSAAVRKRMIEVLKTEDIATYSAFREDLRHSEGGSHFAHSSGRYPFCGRGDINTYSVFAETNRLLINSTGRVGCILPSGIATDDTTKLFFQDIIKGGFLASFLDFENGKGLFPSVQGNIKFCLFTITSTPQAQFRVSAQMDDIAMLKDPDRQYMLSISDIEVINPNTMNCPTFRTARDAELIKAIHLRVPVIIKEDPQGQNPWGFSFMRTLHMTSDSSLFHTKEDLEAGDWILKGNIYYKEKDKLLPLYESKLANQYNHRAATFDGIPPSERFRLHARTNIPSQMDLRNPSYVVTPRYWVSEMEVASRFGDPISWVLGFRNAISAVADSRSFVATIVPRSGVGNSLPLVLFSGGGEAASALVSAMNSFILDYVLRQKASGGNLNFYVLKQLPFLQPETFKKNTKWSLDETLYEWITPRVIELTYTGWDLELFAQDCGYNNPPFRWDEERRFLLRCELDAAYFHLYEIARNDVAYVMDTFPVVQRKDEEKYGEYRTKRVILESYDAMQRAIETGVPYQTLLDPPPADSQVCHPPKSGQLAGSDAQEAALLDGQNLQAVRATRMAEGKGSALPEE